MVKNVYSNEVKVKYFQLFYGLVKWRNIKKHLFELEFKFGIRSAVIRYFQHIVVKPEAFFRKKPPEALHFG